MQSKLKVMIAGKAAKLIAFTILIIGTTGLILNEFVIDRGTFVTLIFAVLNVVGLAIIVFSNWVKMAK